MNPYGGLGSRAEFVAFDEADAMMGSGAGRFAKGLTDAYIGEESGQKLCMNTC